MLWYICFVLALLCLIRAGIVLCNHALGQLRSGLAMADLSIAAFLLYIPVFRNISSVFDGLLMNFINVMQVISLDADYSAYYSQIRQTVTPSFFAALYTAILGLVHFTLPVISLLAAFSILLRCYYRVQMEIVNRKKDPIFLFSVRNDAARLLADSIRAREPNACCIFAAQDGETADDVERQNGYILQQLPIDRIPVSRRHNKEVYYFCMSGTDEDLNAALRLLTCYADRSVEEQKRTHIFLFSEQRELAAMLDSAEKGVVDLRIIRHGESIAYQLLDKYPLFRAIQNGHLSVLLAGELPIRDDLLRAIAWCGQIEGCKLTIHIAGKGVAAFRDDLAWHAPDLLTDAFDFRFYDCQSSAALLDCVRQNCADASYVIAGEADDGATIELALQLRRWFYRSTPAFSKAPPIFAYIRNDEKFKMVKNLHTSESNPKRRVSYQLTPFGNDASIYTYENLIEAPLEVLSRNVHLVYEDIFSENGVDVEAALTRYNELEVNKRSNRANALHIRYKLAALGLDFTDDANAKAVNMQDYLTPALLDSLTRAEHDRWAAFLQSEGWSAASLDEVRAYQASGISAGRHNCPLLRMHPYICSFDALDACAEALGLPDSKVYDRELIARIPDILQDKWGVSGKRYTIVRASDHLTF